MLSAFLELRNEEGHGDANERIIPAFLCDRCNKTTLNKSDT
jgi:hypothetical protein